MKLVLASYFEPQFHGSGRKIGISTGKPNNLDYDCDEVFEPLTPPATAYWDYQKNKSADKDSAGKAFRDAYRNKLEETIKQAKEMAQSSGKSLIDIFPFKEGDTLLSWEHKGHTTYRTMLAEYLREIGFDVEEN